MKLWIFSDLHLEYAELKHPLLVPDADVCVVAGDLTRSPASGVRWLADNVAALMPCIYVAGNHEFYGGAIKEGLEEGRAAARQHDGIHFLENETVEISGIRFIGSTLWTDFGIEGGRQSAMLHARDRMNDYRRIASQKSPWQRFVPETAYRMHMESRQFIEAQLASDAARAVVVTHHLPHASSIPARYKGDLINAAYASDLSSLFEAGGPLLWVHGHTHESCDYAINGTRVVCNPRGYADENRRFDDRLVIVV